MPQPSGMQLAILVVMQDHKLVELMHGYFLFNSACKLAARIRKNSVAKLLQTKLIKDAAVTRNDFKEHGIQRALVLSAAGRKAIVTACLPGKGPSKSAVKKLTTVRRFVGAKVAV